jgi:V/A-type H+/Na+-transporting ATPase subunit G/H
MSLDAIAKVTETEERSKERRTAAEAEAKQILAEAEKQGLALLQRVHSEAEEEQKMLLQKAEEHAASRSDEILRKAGENAGTLRAAAEAHLGSAAEFIVGRVVKD